VSPRPAARVAWQMGARIENSNRTVMRGEHHGGSIIEGVRVTVAGRACRRQEYQKGSSKAMNNKLTIDRNCRG